MSKTIRVNPKIKYQSGIFKPFGRLEKRRVNKMVRRLKNLTKPGSHRRGTLRFEWGD